MGPSVPDYMNFGADKLLSASPKWPQQFQATIRMSKMTNQADSYEFSAHFPLVELQSPNGSPARSRYVAVPPRACARARKVETSCYKPLKTVWSTLVEVYWCLFTQGSICHQAYENLMLRSQVMASFIGSVPRARARVRTNVIQHNSSTVWTRKESLISKWSLNRAGSDRNNMNKQESLLRPLKPKQVSILYSRRPNFGVCFTP